MSHCYRWRVMMMCQRLVKNVTLYVGTLVATHYQYVTPPVTNVSHQCNGQRVMIGCTIDMSHVALWRVGRGKYVTLRHQDILKKSNNLVLGTWLNIYIEAGLLQI